MKGASWCFCYLFMCYLMSLSFGVLDFWVSAMIAMISSGVVFMFLHTCYCDGENVIVLCMVAVMLSYLSCWSL